MMKTIGGIFPLASGTIKHKGEDIAFYTPHDAYKEGIRIVYQVQSLIGSLRLRKTFFYINMKKENFRFNKGTVNRHCSYGTLVTS